MKLHDDHMVPWTHPNQPTKQHLNRFSQFCKAQENDQQTDRQTNGQTDRQTRTTMLLHL